MLLQAAPRSQTYTRSSLAEIFGTDDVAATADAYTAVPSSMKAASSKINIENGRYYYKFGYNSGWYQTTTSADYNRHVFDFNNNGQFYVDSTLAATLPTTSFTKMP